MMWSWCTASMLTSIEVPGVLLSFSLLFCYGWFLLAFRPWNEQLLCCASFPVQTSNTLLKPLKTVFQKKCGKSTLSTCGIQWCWHHQSGWFDISHESCFCWNSENVSVFLTCSLGSHVLWEWSQPNHLMRYMSCPLTHFLERISSTNYSSSPSMISGPGAMGMPSHCL